MSRAESREQRVRQTGRQTYRESVRERDGQREETEKKKETDRDRERATKRETERQTERALTRRPLPTGAWSATCYHKLDSGAVESVEAAMDGQHALLDDIDDVLVVVVVCPEVKDRELSRCLRKKHLWPHTACTTSPNLKMHPPLHQPQGIHLSQASLSPRIASAPSLY